MTRKTLDAPLSYTRLHEQVADRIRQLILEQSLSTGDPLPSERSLADTLGVSRMVIREAMRVLDTQGLIEIRHGSGAYVKRMDPEEILEPWQLFLRLHYDVGTFNKVAELRRTLEIEIAGKAAQRATEDDIARMAECLDGMVEHENDPEQYSRYDLEFHAAVAAATQNELYPIVLKPLTGLLLEFRHQAHLYHKQRGTQRAIENHRQILLAVTRRDSTAARQAMERDLAHAESILAVARDAQAAIETETAPPAEPAS